MNASKMIAVRSGGHFHKPDPKLTPFYEHTRTIHLEDINTTIYHDFSPEYHMHLHSPWVKNAKQGVALISIYFLLVLVPCWFVGMQIMRWMGAMLYPSVRPGKDHAHMAPALINHLKVNNYENKQDALGRRTGFFYKNTCRQVMEYEYKPTAVQLLESHGFKF
jgi:hypothetical protein